MAKGKRKKKKHSHNCENFQKTDSPSAATKYGENRDITECTCYLKAQKRKILLLCWSRIEACPIHTVSKGSYVSKKRKPKKVENGAPNQPSLASRMGQWLKKKVSKGHSKEHISDNPLEATAVTNSDERSMFQMHCQHTCDDEQRTDYDTEPVSWKLPRRLTCKFLTTPELVQDPVMPLREMCKLALKYRIDRKLHKYRGMDEDNTIKPEYIMSHHCDVEPGPHAETTAEPGQDSVECDTSKEQCLTMLSTAEISNEHNGNNYKEAESKVEVNFDFVRYQEKSLTAVCADILQETTYQ